MKDLIVDIVRPLGDSIVVQCEKEDSAFELERNRPTNRIVLPNKSQAQFRVARIVRIGPGLEHPESGRLLPPKVKVGDRVILFKNTLVDLDAYNDDLKLSTARQVIAVLEDPVPDSTEVNGDKRTAISV